MGRYKDGVEKYEEQVQNHGLAFGNGDDAISGRLWR
jgi:hypothetical protein